MKKPTTLGGERSYSAAGPIVAQAKITLAKLDYPIISFGWQSAWISDCHFR